jgi:hypothetical protein
VAAAEHHAWDREKLVRGPEIRPPAYAGGRSRASRECASASKVAGVDVDVAHTPHGGHGPT